MTNDRNYHHEARRIITSETMMLPQREHLFALWKEIEAMTLRLADLHLRVQKAEAERDSLKVQLDLAEDARQPWLACATDLRRHIARLEMQRNSLKVQLHTAQDALRDLGLREPDAMSLAKADMEVRGER